MRLIDADTAKQTYTADLFDTEEDFERVNDIFDYAPTVEAVVVTRCKDCRNNRELNRKDRLESGYAEGVLWCMARSDGVWADGFCSDGEPKEGTHADDHD